MAIVKQEDANIAETEGSGNAKHVGICKLISHGYLWIFTSPSQSVRRRGSATDNAIPSTAEVKAAWIFTTNSSHNLTCSVLSTETNLFFFQ